MSDICQWNRKSTAMHLLGTLSQSRKQKVLVVRQQIAEGTYDLDMPMDSILDRLLKYLVA